MNVNLKKTKTIKFMHTVVRNAIALILPPSTVAPILMVAPVAIGFLNGLRIAPEGNLVMSLLSLFVGGALSLGTLFIADKGNKIPGVTKFLSTIDSNNFWLSKIKEIAKKSDLQLRVLPQNEKERYKEKIVAQLYILSKEVVSDSFYHTLKDQRSFEKVFNLLKENFKIGSEYHHEKSAVSVFFRRKTMTPQLEQAVKEELDHQKLNLVDFAYDLVAVDRIYNKSDNTAIDNLSLTTLLSLVEIAVKSGQVLDKTETREMCKVIGRIKNNSLLELFLTTMIDHMGSVVQIDKDVLIDFLNHKNSFSASKSDEMIQKITALSPMTPYSREMNSPTEHWAQPEIEAVKIIEKSETRVASESSVFAPQIFAMLEGTQIQNLMSNFNLITRDKKNELILIQTSMEKLHQSMVFVENNCALIDVESRIDLKIAINKSVPHLLNIIKAASVMDKAGQEQIATLSLSTFDSLNTQLTNAKGQIQNGLIKDLSAIDKHQAHRAKMSVNGR